MASVARAIELIAAVEAMTGLEPDRDAVVAELADVLERWGETVDGSFVREAVHVIATIRELARIVDVHDTDAAAAMANAWLERAAVAPTLVHEPGWGWHLHVVRPDADWSTWLLASSSLGFALVLTEYGEVRWGRCAAAGCDRPFFDRGRRDRQRFCSAACATRERVRRHRRTASQADQAT